MQSHLIRRNPEFVGRQREMAKLAAVRDSPEAGIVVVYGHRRIGKTELIEQCYREDFVWKFEGIQPDGRRRRSLATERAYQIANCLRRLARYRDEPAIAKVACGSWTELFELLDPVVRQRPMVLYFEEIQWLANYGSEFLAEMKPFWDDAWRHQPGLTVVLCGSAPSFIAGEIMADKALYARSLHEIHLRELSLVETSELLGLGRREVIQAQLTVGGVPEYLKRLRNAPSVFLGLCEESFLPESFFSREQDRIFVSSLRWDPGYRGIVDYLSRQRYATRDQVRKAVGRGSGGTLTALLRDLRGCGFIEKYTPLHLGPDSLAARYCIADEYLRFYFKFVFPLIARIENGEFADDPTRALNLMSFRQSLGVSFERWCRKHSHLFARILGFSAVEYQCGAFFNRRTAELDQGFQIDLAYVRKDGRVLVCEIKHTDRVVGIEAAEAVAEKVARFRTAYPRCRDRTFETVLITTASRQDALHLRGHFDHVVTFDDIFDERYW